MTFFTIPSERTRDVIVFRIVVFFIYIICVTFIHECIKTIELLSVSALSLITSVVALSVLISLLTHEPKDYIKSLVYEQRAKFKEIIFTFYELEILLFITTMLYSGVYLLIKSELHRIFKSETLLSCLSASIIVFALFFIFIFGINILKLTMFIAKHNVTLDHEKPKI